MFGHLSLFRCRPAYGYRHQGTINFEGFFVAPRITDRRASCRMAIALVSLSHPLACLSLATACVPPNTIDASERGPLFAQRLMTITPPKYILLPPCLSAPSPALAILVASGNNSGTSPLHPVLKTDSSSRWSGNRSAPGGASATDAAAGRSARGSRAQEVRQGERVQ